MESFFIKAAQLLLSLSILVILHELGHFIPAKLFKTRVEKFYLFFNPWFSLFKIKKGETEYGLGWLPLGGYVKIAGMIDESMDKEQLEKPAEPWEFRAKPAWQRLIIMLGGVVVNFILAMIIYSFVLFTWGKEYLPVENAIYGVTCDSLMLSYGFEEGDKIISVGNTKPKTFSDINKAILLENVREITVERNGTRQLVKLPTDVDQQLLNNNAIRLFAARVPFEIDTILPNTPASKSTLQKGDKILAVNEQPAAYFHAFVKAIQPLKGKEVNLKVLRNGSETIVPVTVGEDGKVGIGNKSPLDYFKFEKQEYTLTESFPAGIDHGVNVLVGYVEQMKLVFTPAGVKHLGGFGQIGGLFSAQWNWQNFWEMTAFLSVVLAFMNILPIPALDGGHVTFLLYEMITRRKPSEQFLEYAQIAGMVILFSLMLYANGNDLFKFLYN